MAKDNLFVNRTLWLDREHMDIARDRFFKAWLATTDQIGIGLDQKNQWDLAWAAAIAACSFVMEGNLGPHGEESEST